MNEHPRLKKYLINVKYLACGNAEKKTGIRCCKNYETLYRKGFRSFAILCIYIYKVYLLQSPLTGNIDESSVTLLLLTTERTNRTIILSR